MDLFLYVIAFVLLLFWLFPAIYLTYNISTSKQIDDINKNLFLKKIWLVPIFGVLFCMIILAKTGKLNKLSKSEHRNLW
jgi:hypothetical protein